MTFIICHSSLKWKVWIKGHVFSSSAEQFSTLEPLHCNGLMHCRPFQPLRLKRHTQECSQTCWMKLLTCCSLHSLPRSAYHAVFFWWAVSELWMCMVVHAPAVSSKHVVFTPIWQFSTLLGFFPEWNWTPPSPQGVVFFPGFLTKIWKLGGSISEAGPSGNLPLQSTLDRVDCFKETHHSNSRNCNGQAKLKKGIRLQGMKMRTRQWFHARRKWVQTHVSIPHPNTHALTNSRSLRRISSCWTFIWWGPDTCPCWQSTSLKKSGHLSGWWWCHSPLQSCAWSHEPSCKVNTLNFKMIWWHNWTASCDPKGAGLPTRGLCGGPHRCTGRQSTWTLTVQTHQKVTWQTNEKSVHNVSNINSQTVCSRSVQLSFHWNPSAHAEFPAWVEDYMQNKMNCTWMTSMTLPPAFDLYQSRGWDSFQAGADVEPMHVLNDHLEHPLHYEASTPKRTCHHNRTRSWIPKVPDC